MQSQRKSTKNLQHHLFALWDEFDDGRHSTMSLLKACSSFYLVPPPRGEWRNTNMVNTKLFIFI